MFFFQTEHRLVRIANPSDKIDGWIRQFPSSGPFLPTSKEKHVKQRIASLLRSIGLVLNVFTLLAASLYVVSVVMWIHAPVLQALWATFKMALIPLVLAWLCKSLGRHLQRQHAGTPSSPTRQRVLAAVGIVTVLGCAYVGYRVADMVQCSEDHARNAAAREALSQKNGYRMMCRGDLSRYDISLRSLEKATRKLAFTPLDLTHTPFAQLEIIGALAEHMWDVPSVLYRGFRLPDGHTMILYEHDLSADGTSTWRDPKDEPERIKGMPARLVVMEEPSGKAVSILNWVEGRRDIQLWIDANVVRQPLREQLFALAASLPKSVPACPNEPPPAVMTQEQFDAIADRGKRPCK
jgi:hypothetical protein